ncbi:hypothetical protein LguiA_015878 [Lonicera macranthoides]
MESENTEEQLAPLISFQENKYIFRKEGLEDSGASDLLLFFKKPSQVPFPVTVSFNDRSWKGSS